MYPRAVARAVRRINYRKVHSDPPVAEIGNTCRAAVTYSINKKDFIDNIYPLALNNGWISGPSSLKYNFETTQFDDASSTIRFEEDLFNTVRVMANVILAQNAITITYFNGSSVRYSINIPLGNFSLIICPLAIIAFQSNSACRLVVLDTPVNSNIKSIQLTSGTFSASVDDYAYGITSAGSAPVSRGIKYSFNK